MTNELCNACQVGYHAPFERFQQVAVHEHGPTFLKRCERCGTLWHETLRDARIVSVEEAKHLYSDASLP
ncbi:hypothetical protein [Sphingosinicella sp. YJ22]|uniref:hypothetical protein n=1 Tax=Sphingosinicella sp. YJ22 TaxID=1104780 RepID=UPI00140B27EF|nr:hypothetical protein [Sphingosinicella sp. YJ22]